MTGMIIITSTSAIRIKHIRELAEDNIKAGKRAAASEGNNFKPDNNELLQTGATLALFLRLH